MPTEPVPGWSEAATLRAQLLHTLTDHSTRYTARADVRLATDRLIRRIKRDKPSAYTVALAVRLIGGNVEAFLGATPESTSFRVEPPDHSCAEPTLSARHIFDLHAVTQLGDSELASAVKALGIKAAVTEATAEQAFIAEHITWEAIKDWASVKLINDVKRMREIMWIRRELERERFGDDSPAKAMRYLADAEAIGLALSYTDHDHPARIVTRSPSTVARYKRFGVAGTTTWGMFADAITEGRLDRTSVGFLRSLRSRHDPHYDSDSTGWPMTANPVSRDSSPPRHT